MDFKIEERKKRNLDKYHPKNLDLALKFAKEIYKELGKLVKGVILFGSTARKQPSNDIDILLILDDVRFEMSEELVHTYRIITEKTIAKTSTLLHVTTMRFTHFWEYVRAGDPVAVNMLRDGVPLIDTGFFAPLQILLYQGRIRPSEESVWTYYTRAPRTLHNSRWHLMQGTLDLYWAVIDAAHAALMKLNVVPPSPEHVADLLEEKMVKTGLLDRKFPPIMREFYTMSKAIVTGEIKDMNGQQFEEYYKEAKEFVEAIKAFLDK